MSTRCIVRVVNSKAFDKEVVQLYHHHDGYPEYMIPCLLQARKMGEGLCKKFNVWKLGRVSTAAAIICAADPVEFEPEDPEISHGDLEFTYRVDVADPNNWTVTVGSDQMPPGYMKGYPLEEYAKGYDEGCYEPVLSLVESPEG